MRNTVSLKKNHEFLRAYKRGKFYVGRFLVLYAFPNKSSSIRLGITASKKAGKSVRRNRIKRLVRESYRASEQNIKKGYDLVFSARSSEKMPGYSDILKEMKFLLRKLGVYIRENEDI